MSTAGSSIGIDPASAEVAEPPIPQGARLRNAAIRLALIVGIIVAVLIAGPGLTSVRERLAGGEPSWLVLATIFELGSCVSYVVLFNVVFCRRMRWRISYQIAMTGLGVNALIPAGGTGGLALGGWVLHHRGMETARVVRRSAAFFLLTSAANFGVLGVAGIGLATGLFSDARAHIVSLVFGIVGLAAFPVVAAVPVVVARLQRRHRARHDGAEPGRMLRLLIALADAVRDAGELIRAGNPLLWVGSLGYLLFDIGVVWAAFKAFGHPVAIAPLSVAYVIAMLGNLIPLPGGLGAGDGALVGMLVLYGSPLAVAVAAALAYRAFVLVVPAALGLLASLQLRRTLREGDRASAELRGAGEAASA